jgi:hypothetical protein
LPFHRSLKVGAKRRAPRRAQATALLLAIPLLLSVACGPASFATLPSRIAPAATIDLEQASGSMIPPTWTPAPDATPPTATPPTATPPAMSAAGFLGLAAPVEPPAPIPTNTPVPPTSTPTNTPTATPDEASSAAVRPLNLYARSEIVPFEAFPRPPGDNGWGMHWIPTVSQEPAVVDRFVDQLIRMHIKWVVFLNDGTQIGRNDYLVDRLVQAGIMPVMRVYRSNVLPYDGELGPMVAHYRARGVYYYQLYNEPNVNEENSQGFSNPNVYATAWAAAAREVIEHGGLPGLGALSPGGAFNHYNFLERTLLALRHNGDQGLLNRAWISVHNYHGLRALGDEDGFLLFRKYDEIIRNHLGRSLPMIGTEGGSYSANAARQTELLAYQYRYMREAEPYFFAFSYWVLANLEGGSADPSWEYQTLFRSGYVHPVVTQFFYRNRR